MSDSLRPLWTEPARLLCPWDSPGKSTRVGCLLLPGDLPDTGIKPASLTSPALAGGFFTTSATWEALNQLYVDIYHLPPLIPPLWVITEPQAELPVIYSSFPLALYLHKVLSMSVPVSRFSPPSPSRLCPRVCSEHLCLYSCLANKELTCSDLHRPDTAHRWLEGAAVGSS